MNKYGTKRFFFVHIGKTPERLVEKRYNHLGQLSYIKTPNALFTQELWKIYSMILNSIQF